jgi:lipid A 4'-phosphatase
MLWGTQAHSASPADGVLGLFMNYLQQTRTRIILAGFLISSVVLVLFSGIDIRISRLFFDQGFLLAGQSWYALFRQGTIYSIVLSLVAVVGFNRVAKRNLCGVDARKVVYLLCVLILGAGLIVNVIFKEGFGRARPRDIEEFGGSKHFTPVYIVSHECKSNCSFSSGEGAGAFFALALAMALSRKRKVFLAGVGFGCLVSILRIASGAHFFSDSVVSFFVMLIVADVLYYYMVLPKTERGV